MEENIDNFIEINDLEILYSNEDYEMLAGENKNFALFLTSLGYSQDNISEIANAGDINNLEIDSPIIEKLKFSYQKISSDIIDKHIESLIEEIKVPGINKREVISKHLETYSNDLIDNTINELLHPEDEFIDIDIVAEAIKFQKDNLKELK